VVIDKEVDTQLSLELKKVQKKKRARPSGEVTKAMKTQTPNPFIGKDTKAKMVK
jgi:hypothetical protein